MSNSNTVASVSTKLFLLSLLSPLVGILVEISLANTFGSSALVDAYRISFLLLMFGAQLFFGQLVTGVLVPLVADYNAKGMEQEGWRVAFSIAGGMVLVTLPGVVFVVFKPEVLQQLLGPGLTADAALQAQLMLRFFAIVFLVYIWTGVINGLLHSYQVFWVQPVAQLVANASLVCLIIVAGRRLQEWGFIIAVGFASVLSILFCAIAIRRVSLRHSVSLSSCFRIKLSIIPLDMLRLAVPIIGLIFATMWSSLVVNRSLSEISVGAVADYGYAIKFEMLGSLLPLTLATVLFPRLASAASSKDMESMAHLASRGLQWMLFISVPAAVVIFFVREPLVVVFYQHGEMSNDGIRRVSDFLGILSFVIPVAASNYLLFKVSYAMKNSVAPLIGQLIVAVGLSLLASTATQYGGENGIVAVYASLTWIAVIFLVIYLQSKYGFWGHRQSMKFLWRLVVSVVLTAFAMKIANVFVLWLSLKDGGYEGVASICLVMFVGLCTFLFVAKLLKFQELDEIKSLFLSVRLGRFIS